MKTLDRQQMLKACVRGGILAGLVGLGAVLMSRGRKFECTSPCGQCPKLKNGKCGLK